MNPLRDALIGGVLPGAIATFALLIAGVAMALRRGPLPPTQSLPERPHAIAPRGVIERLFVLVAMLVVGGGVVLSMRLLEPYPGWWSNNIPHRTPALVGIGAIAAAIVAAGPARWWFALPVCMIGAGLISYGMRQPLPSTGNLPFAMVLDALAIGPAAFLVQKLVDRAANADRSLLTRPLPIVALALALLPVPGILFFSGISVSSRQFGVVMAVLISSAVVLATVGHCAGRGAFRGIGVLGVLTIGVWMLLARAVGIPALSGWAIVFMLVAAIGAGVGSLLVARTRSPWLAAIITLLFVGAPMAGALAAQYAAGDRSAEPGESAADYGY